MFWIEGLITIPKFVAKKRLSLELQQLIFCGCQNQVLLGETIAEYPENWSRKRSPEIAHVIHQTVSSSIHLVTHICCRAELTLFTSKIWFFSFAVEQKTKKGLKFANCNNLLIILLPSLLEKFFQEKSSSSHNKNNNVCKSLVSIKFFVAKNDLLLYCTLC